MSFWYPFRSPQVSDIASHLTVEERALFGTRVQGEGTWFGRRVGVIVVGTVLPTVWLTHSFLLSLGLALILSQLIIWTIYGSWIRKNWKATRELLCSTQYARQAGFRSDSLPIYRFWF
jgi:hypothetical protein